MTDRLQQKEDLKNGRQGVGVDVRVLFDKPFSGDSHNQLRFTTGVVFRTW